MDCPACSFDNPAGLKFCGNCGQRFPSGCPGCGFENPSGFKFCGECGTSLAAAPQAPALAAQERAPSDYTPKHLADKILRSKSALEGERKQVTVLFADVKGSTELAEELDPEEWHAILDRFFQILSDGVHRFEGTVNQYTGDGIMALFGAPIAHEDHAQRACFSALWLRDELRRYAEELRLSRGLGFSVRMGLNSGEVVVGRIGDDLRMDYTAQGATVNLAARMQQIAAPDRIYVSEATATLVGGYLALRDLGPAQVKGVAEPVPVYELEGIGEVRTRLDVSRSRGLSRFVGRDDETELVEFALERALAGSGQVVGVVAEAGTGKSRLCYEFVERCRARGMLVRETHGVAHGEAVPLLPILEFYRATLGIEDRDDDRTARQKVAGAVAQLDKDLLDSLPLLFDFLGIPDPESPVSNLAAPERQHRLLALLKRMTLARSEREPAVILFEDLHWIDAATETFVEMLVDAVQGTRTLLLANFRPEYQADWMRRSYYQRLALAPLDAEAIREMLDDLLGDDPSLAGLAERIHARTLGNPFFAEEVVQSMIESGALAGTRGAYRLLGDRQSLDIPPSVNVLLASRIDRLPEREKRVLQTASVIDREFSAGLLARVVEIDESELQAALTALVQAEFLYEIALYPEQEYAFKHPLTQEVSYDSQLRERRARVHESLAKALEVIHADQLDEKAALLAHHWERAGDDAEAARWHRRAADWAGGRDPLESLRHWRRVRALCAELPESPETLELAVTCCARIVSAGARVADPEPGFEAESEQAYREGMELARRSGNRRAEADLLLSRGTALFFAGAPRAESRELLARSVEIAEKIGHTATRVVASNYLCAVSNDPGAVCHLAGGAIELAAGDRHMGESLLGSNPLLGLYGQLAGSLARLGRLPEARAARAEGLRLVEHVDEPVGECLLHFWSFPVLEAEGDAAAMLQDGRRMVEIADATTNRPLKLAAWSTLAQALFASGDHGAASAACERSREHGHLRTANVSTLAIQARTAVAGGEPERALQLAERSVEEAALEGRLQIPARLARARVRLAIDGPAAAAEIERDLDVCAEVSRSVPSRCEEPEVHVVRAELARAPGDGARADREIAEARRLYQELGAPRQVERLDGELRAATRY